MAVRFNQRYAQYFFEPVAESFEEEHWNAIKKRELVFQRCAKCKTWLHPPRPMCYQCHSYDLEWVKSSGKGKIYSWVTFTREANPFYKVPYEVVLVEMDDEKGVRFISNMAEGNAEDLYIGMPVELVWVDVTKEQPLPMFRPAK
jgi:uncharacterized OB-fold protein